MIWLYARVSTKKQDITRQIRNLTKAYPEYDKLIQEVYTGRDMTHRPKFKAMLDDVKPGDVIVCDEVSRFGRGDVEETFAIYENLYSRGIDIIFLKEPGISTTTYRETASKQVGYTGTDADIILEAVNKYLMILAKKQIKYAFEKSKSEVDYLSKRTKEGQETARLSGKHTGITQGIRLYNEKYNKAVPVMLKHCPEFNGSMTNKEVMKLAGINPGTFYKYKKHMLEVYWGKNADEVHDDWIKVKKEK